MSSSAYFWKAAALQLERSRTLVSALKRSGKLSMQTSLETTKKAWEAARDSIALFSVRLQTLLGALLIVRLFELFDVEFDHLKHGMHHAFGPGGVLIAQ